MRIITTKWISRQYWAGVRTNGIRNVRSALDQFNRQRNLANQIRSVSPWFPHIAGALLITLALVMIPKFQANEFTDAKQRFDAEDAARKTIAQILAGGFFFVTAYFTWRTVKAAESNVTVGQRNVAIAEDRLTSERFFKATEGLESKNVLTRTASIYTLERIAEDSARERKTVTDVLCDFIRNGRIVVAPVSRGDIPDREGEFPKDIQSAITVLGRLNKRWPGEVDIELARTDLRGADFYRSDFSRSNFTRSWLDGADLMGADFSRCVLDGASLDYADTTGTDFSRSHLDLYSFENVELGDAYLDGIIVPMATFSAIQAKLSEADQEEDE
ncbi:Pentapeptide repeats (8 copies) [Aquisphaera giovannonii]|uniref:Pentapeptide repeats (8 copies) n=1 Tax=Aquisphaera giovannonii TaxID=406548 RepID=A0A5B9VXD7_9BACT|nr:pentapeptide repeat-containing protein [Aquisphaera giovannonii]QEH32779.1 Pentapeptide repeats (8 copies) [Aquisphaera giovannonii]